MADKVWNERDKQLTLKLKSIRSMRWDHALNGPAAFEQADRAAWVVPFLLEVIDALGAIADDNALEAQMLKESPSSERGGCVG